MQRFKPAMSSELKPLVIAKSVLINTLDMQITDPLNWKP